MTTNLLSDPIQPKTQKYQERVNLTRVAWRFNQYRQALHPTDPKLGKTPCVAWRLGVCRQVVPFPGTQNTCKGMCRLAAMSSPPGGFWKFPKTRKINQK